MLDIEQINFSYSNKSVLADISISILDASIIGLVGLNGAGKTTLLEIIAGFLKPTSGKITFSEEGKHIDHIAYLETNPFFYPNITGQEYLELLTFNNKQFDIERWNSFFQLPLLDLIETYSSGMRKKLAFMGMMALNRKYLLLDEPFNTLDMESVEVLKLLLVELKKQGKVIIITSHILETLTSTCDHLYYLMNGEIEGSYTKQQFPDLAEELHSITKNKYSQLIKDSF
jgi:ABC-2 type transport system ATP-binding protein